MNIIRPYTFYEKEDIEGYAESVVRKVKSTRTRPLKNYDVAETVADYLGLDYVWTPIKPDSQGEVVAMIIPLERKILINENVPYLTDAKYSRTCREGLKNSTLAHEIGHWLLHINRDIVDKYKDRSNNDVDREFAPFLCRQPAKARGIEWQADFFASCLLMPVSELDNIKRGRDLTNKRHLQAMADELGVTLSNLINRLCNIGWIERDRNQIYLK